jgi:predicted HTH transcriptional regulator
MEYVQDKGRITIKEAHQIINSVSPATVRKRIAGLVNKGLLSQQGKGRGTWYQL